MNTDQSQRMQQDIAGLKEGQTKIEGDITTLKEDARGLKEDVRGLKADVKELRNDVDELKEDVRGLQVQNETILEKIDQIIEIVAPQMEKTTELQLENEDQNETLQNHEIRIGVLENNA